MFLVWGELRASIIHSGRVVDLEGGAHDLDVPDRIEGASTTREGFGPEGLIYRKVLEQPLQPRFCADSALSTPRSKDGSSAEPASIHERKLQTLAAISSSLVCFFLVCRRSPLVLCVRIRSWDLLQHSSQALSFRGSSVAQSWRLPSRLGLAALRFRRRYMKEPGRASL